LILAIIIALTPLHDKSLLPNKEIIHIIYFIK
jgi:hypothetical protein